jgi:peptide/nickel transport system substrate-binding protein
MSYTFSHQNVGTEGREIEVQARRWLLGGALASLLLALVGCGGGGSATSSSGGGGAKNAVGVYCATSEVMVFWDPSTSFSNEIIAMANMYEGLLRYDPLHDRFIPVLATRYEKSSDGLTWTFHLRHNVRFHDGSLMTSADVKASIERTIELGQGASYIWSAVKSIDTPDPYTVVFHLKYPAPLDFVAASPYAAWIFNPNALKQHGANWFAQGHEDGTGPYELQSWSQGHPLVLKAFPQYWGGWKGPHYTKVVFETIPSSSTKAQMLTSGQCTYADILPYEQIQALKGNPKVRIVVSPSFQNLIAFFNTKKKPLDDVRVREALSYAFPYAQVIRDVMHGYARQSQGPVPYGLWGHDPNLPQFHQDLTKAAALLRAAGIRPGTLNLTLTYTAGDDNEQSTAALYKAALQQIGVNLTVRPMPWTAQWNLAKATDPNARQDIFMMYWWPDYTNPYSFLYNMFHSESTINFNMAYYSNPTFDRLIDRANEEAGVDRAAAERLYAQAQEVLFKDAPAIPIFDEQYVRAVSADLHGFVDNPSYPNVVFWHDVHP